MDSFHSPVPERVLGELEAVDLGHQLLLLLPHPPLVCQELGLRGRLLLADGGCSRKQGT